MEEVPYRITLPPTFLFSIFFADFFILPVCGSANTCSPSDYLSDTEVKYVLCECIIHKRKPLLLAAPSIRLPFCMQGDSRLMDISAGDDFLGLRDQKGSYKVVSDFGVLRRYGRLNHRIEGKDY